MAYRVIGRSPRRSDAWEKVRGRPIYAGDLALSGMLHGRIVRSPYASARIVRIDTAVARGAARAWRGAHRARRAAQRAPDELPAAWPRPRRRRPGHSARAGRRSRAFPGRARRRHRGETPRCGGGPPSWSRWSTRSCPGVYDPLAALAPDAPSVHEAGNLLRSWHLRSGESARAFARADGRRRADLSHPVRRSRISGDRDRHRLDRRRGRPGAAREHPGARALPRVAAILRLRTAGCGSRALPRRRLRRQGRCDRRMSARSPGLEDASTRSARILARGSFIGHGKRHPYVMRYRTGATRDGTLTALEAELISDSGAYAALSPWVLLYSLVTAPGPIGSRT